MHIDIPRDVSSILEKLKTHGFLAYVVGGSVRDSLLGKLPGDWDITTSAHPQDIKRLFNRTVDTGIRHGTVTVLYRSMVCELTTFRSDGEYLDHRHPDGVRFSDTLEEDLRRRDFTINAMAYNDSEGLIDLFHGEEDLKQGLIRAVGEANERFDEDALRMLRAVRFAGQLGFGIEEGTRKAISSHAADLKYVSRERIYSEICKLICSAHLERIKDIFDLGMAPYIADYFEEIDLGQVFALKASRLGHDDALRKENNPFTDDTDTYYNHKGDKGATLSAWAHPESLDASGRHYSGKGRSAAKSSLKSSAFELGEETDTKYSYIRFAFVTEGMEHEHVRALLKSLKADNDTIFRAGTLSGLVLQPFSDDGYEFKKLMSGVDEELFLDAILMKLCSWQTKLYLKSCRREYLFKVIVTYGGIIKEKEPVYLKDLAVTGDDLIELGIAKGPLVGCYLRKLLDFVHRWPEANDKKKLLRLVRKWQEEI